MKKIISIILLFVIYSAAYILSHRYDILFLPSILFFFILPFNIDNLLFDKKRYGLSLFLGGIFIIFLLFAIGTDYSRVLNIDLNAYASLFYFALATFFIISGLIWSIIDFLKRQRIKS